MVHRNKSAIHSRTWQVFSRVIIKRVCMCVSIYATSFYVHMHLLLLHYYNYSNKPALYTCFGILFNHFLSICVWLIIKSYFYCFLQFSLIDIIPISFYLFLLLFFIRFIFSFLNFSRVSFFDYQINKESLEELGLNSDGMEIRFWAEVTTQKYHFNVSLSFFNVLLQRIDFLLYIL